MILLLFSTAKVMAQDISYKVQFDADTKDLICSKAELKGSEETVEQVDRDDCLKNVNNLKTPLKYIFNDTKSVCFAFIDEVPFYYVGKAPDKSFCQAQTNEDLDFTPNVIKYSENRIHHLCQEIGNCLSTLSSQSQELVDDTISILKEIRIHSKLQELKESVEKDQLNFTLPVFLKELDDLEKHNEQCHNNLTYGEGHDLAARAALANDLEAISGTLKDDLYVFHWYVGLTSTLSTAKNGDSNMIARAHASMLQDNYFSFDTDLGTGMQGRGLYASPGPNATSSYGNILLKIRVPKGSKYINMGNDDIPLSRKTVELLERAGCDIMEGRNTKRYNGNLYANKIDFSANRACRKVYNDVIEQEKYIFHSYDYNRRRNVVCDQKFDQAVVLIQNEMSSENVRAYRNPFDQKYSEMSDEVKDIRDLIKNKNELSQERYEELKKRYRKHLWQCE